MERQIRIPEFEYINCLVCGSKNGRPLFKKGQFDLPAFSCICKDCGFVYLNPRWTRTKYNDFYKNEYDSYYRPKVQTIRNSNNVVSESIFKRLNKLKQITNILDIGSGDGQILNYFKEKYPKSNLHAIEPSPNCQKKLVKMGVNLLHHDVDSDWHLNYKNTFDLIILRHVLEHFLNPLEVLKKISYVLSKSGVAYIAVPNMLRPRGSLKKYWFRSVHVSYFTKYSFLILASKVNLNISDLRTSKSELYGIFNKSNQSRIIPQNKYRIQMFIIYISMIYNFTIESLFLPKKILKQILRS